jgi:hypothetical protein
VSDQNEVPQKASYQATQDVGPQGSQNDGGEEKNLDNRDEERPQEAPKNNKA